MLAVLRLAQEERREQMAGRPALVRTSALVAVTLAIRAVPATQVDQVVAARTVLAVLVLVVRDMRAVVALLLLAVAVVVPVPLAQTARVLLAQREATESPSLFPAHQSLTAVAVEVRVQDHRALAAQVVEVPVATPQRQGRQTRVAVAAARAKAQVPHPVARAL